MINKIWRYSVNLGEFGGIVLAGTEEEAMERARNVYPVGDIEVWPMLEDDYFDPKNPAVLEIYGI